jgi:hypothetical protein
VEITSSFCSFCERPIGWQRSYRLIDFDPDYCYAHAECEDNSLEEEEERESMPTPTCHDA